MNKNELIKATSIEIIKIIVADQIQKPSHERYKLYQYAAEDAAQQAYALAEELEKLGVFETKSLE